MGKQDLILVYSTFPDQQVAKEIAKDVVEMKLAACANIIGGVNSIYEWKGEVQYDDEISVLFKTVRARQIELIKRLRQLHPYETPALVTFEASHVEENYLSWVREQTSRSGPLLE